MSESAIRSVISQLRAEKHMRQEERDSTNYTDLHEGLADELEAALSAGREQAVNRVDYAIALATIESLRTRIASCEAALEAAYAAPTAGDAADARRYRWLRDNCIKPRSVNPEMDCGYELKFEYHLLFNEPDLGYAIDMRIKSKADAALSAAPAGRGK